MFKNKNAKQEITEGIPALYPRLWRYCLALTSSSERADDLAQSTCLRALEKAHQFERGTHQDRWMFRIAQRLWINEIRSEAVGAVVGWSQLMKLSFRTQKVPTRK